MREWTCINICLPFCYVQGTVWTYCTVQLYSVPATSYQNTYMSTDIRTWYVSTNLLVLCDPYLIIWPIQYLATVLYLYLYTVISVKASSEDVWRWNSLASGASGYCTAARYKLYRYPVLAHRVLVSSLVLQVRSFTARRTGVVQYLCSTGTGGTTVVLHWINFASVGCRPFPSSLFPLAVDTYHQSLLQAWAIWLLNLVQK